MLCSERRCSRVVSWKADPGASTPPFPGSFSFSFKTTTAAWTMQIGVVTYPTSGPVTLVIFTVSGGDWGSPSGRDFQPLDTNVMEKLQVSICFKEGPSGLNNPAVKKRRISKEKFPCEAEFSHDPKQQAKPKQAEDGQYAVIAHIGWY